MANLCREDSVEKEVGDANRSWVAVGMDWILRGNSNVRFCQCLALLVAIQTAVVFAPIVRDEAYSRAAEMDDTTPERKPIYAGSTFRISGILAVAAVACYALTFNCDRFRFFRTLVLLGAVSYLAILVPVRDHHSFQRRMVADLSNELASSKAFELREENLDRLQIIECSSLNLQSFELRTEFRRRNLKTFTNFHQCVMEHFAVRSPELKRDWANVCEHDDKKLKALFVMNFVSGLWGYGNIVNLDKPGCVLTNEHNDWQDTVPSLSAYLDSDIGCCTDFAFLTKSLLDHEGIDNRLTSIPGHVFNEVRLNGRWCILDATMNIFVQASWDELYVRETRDKAIIVLVFPHANLADTKSPQYRPAIGQLRLLTLNRLANRPESLRESQRPTLPSYFD